jgi:hypothetical protein
MRDVTEISATSLMAMLSAAGVTMSPALLEALTLGDRYMYDEDCSPRTPVPPGHQRPAELLHCKAVRLAMSALWQ